MSRKAAREIAVKMAYEKLFGCDDTYATVSEISGIDAEPLAEDVEFANSIVDGISMNREAIDELISSKSKGWAIDRMPKIDASVLRVAVYELLYDKKAPRKVIVNEAVRIATKYGGDDSPKFINGILGSILRSNEE
ncbi:MAG: transcription antitermination factor NusB [Clostridiales bacterium]|nr:transcription antitermination factor NusB [Clostridiales bacterium]